MAAIPAPDLVVRVTFHGFAREHEGGRFATVMVGRDDLQVIRPGDGPTTRVETIATRDSDGFWHPSGTADVFPDVIVRPVSPEGV